jgi:AbiA family abortive infection protein
MFEISYDTWHKVCDMYLSKRSANLHSYLQWFPYSKLEKDDIHYTRSEEFYNKYIKHGHCVLFSSVMFRTENYLQKSDGSFRNATLISPLLYLILQCIGKTIADKYQSKRPTDIEVFYGGNYQNMDGHYKIPYYDFFASINREINNYDYFIKTDVRNFYDNIKLNTLMAEIDGNVNFNETIISPSLLHLYKNIFSYCGSGKYPLVENSVASSYLSTIIYLEPIDCELYEYLSEGHYPEITKIKMVRYVDDLYILIKSDSSLQELNKVTLEIFNKYASILKKYGLSLNTLKCCLKNSNEILDELRNSFYDEQVLQKKYTVPEIFPNGIVDFLERLNQTIESEGSISVKRYNEIIFEVYSTTEIEFQPQEILNYFVYDNPESARRIEAINLLLIMIKRDSSFIHLDPKRLTILIMQTHSETAIKNLLTELFNRDRTNKWNSYDTTIAINYLIKRNVKHDDLLSVIERRVPELTSYNTQFCTKSFISHLSEDKIISSICNCINTDDTANYLYLMYVIEKENKNWIEAYAYFITFFERVTANVDCKLKGKSVKFRDYFAKDQLIETFKNIPDSKEILDKAILLRNQNPLAHASSELLKDNSSSLKLDNSIADLTRLLISFFQYNNLI